MYPESNRNTLFPVFLKTDHLHTLIVGGGNVGLEKLRALMANSPNATITLVATEIHPEIKKLAALSSNIQLAERGFSNCDLYAKDIAIIATDNAVENKRIHDIAKSMRVLVNVADTPDLCDFYLGSVVQKGNIKIAISTNGQSPTVAKRIREVLTDLIPDEMEEMLNNLEQIRKKITGGFAEKVKQLNKITSVLIEK
ncbi:MAG: bifunctional precorrin-2 dehydrogenase/sirohydrochlorin ferrochelatase [Chitinophagaceae bacterium]|nr:MAG: bifunctional precorrin-2 dehydrogenase/sirohydrochlorin ferrochelatase [Chitinophagaceae bacterium]